MLHLYFLPGNRVIFPKISTSLFSSEACLSIDDPLIMIQECLSLALQKGLYFYGYILIYKINNYPKNLISQMESDITALKIDLLLNIQLNKYDESCALAQKILSITPNDQLINKFSNFLKLHKTEMREMDKEETEEAPVAVENHDSDGSEWESDCDSDFSISNSDEEEEDQENIPEKKEEVKKQGCEKCKQANVNPTLPAKNQKVDVKKAEIKPQPPTKAVAAKKPVEVTNLPQKAATKAKV